MGEKAVGEMGEKSQRVKNIWLQSQWVTNIWGWINTNYTDGPKVRMTFWKNYMDGNFF